jgi:hypothetical protein
MFSEDVAQAIIEDARKRKTWLTKKTREFIERHTGRDAPAVLIDQYPQGWFAPFSSGCGKSRRCFLGIAVGGTCRVIKHIDPAVTDSTFDAGQLRDGANERHPPHVLFVMLFGIGLGASLLAGFGMAATKARSWAHMMIFAGGVAVALFVVTDLEYPRLGLVRVDSFDHFAKALYEQMR